MSKPAVHAVAAGDSAELLLGLRGLYEETFPPEERVAVEAHQARVSAGTSRLRVLATDERTVGFALCTSLATGAWLLEHLATETAFRHRGFGARLLDRVRAELTEEGSTALYLEVEAPELDAKDLWRDRRLTWYQRQGAQVVADHDSYAMPNCLTGAPLPMKLLVMPLAVRSALDGPDLCRDVLALYERVYDLRSDEPMVQKVLGALRC